MKFCLPILAFGSVSGAILGAALRGIARPMLGDPASTDAYMFLWNAWWLKHSWAHLHNPYYCDWIFAPRGAPLVLHTFEPVQATLIALGTLLAPYWISLDLTVWIGLILAGSGMYFLVRYLTRSTVASLAAGLTFMMSPFIMSKTGGHLNMLYAGSVPVFVLALLRALDGQRRDAWLLAAAWLFTIWTSLLNAIFAAHFTLIILGWYLIKRRSVKRLASILTPLLMASLPIAAGILYYMIRFGASPAAMRTYSNIPDIVSYFFPLGPSLYADALYRTGNFHFNTLRVDNAVYLGVLVCPLAAYGLWRARHDKLTPVWALAFCFSLILSIGQVVIHNESPVKLLGMPIYMPFAIWRTIPFLGTMWQSGRYFLIGYCVLAVGIGLLVASIRNPWLRAAIFALIVIDYMPHIAGYSAPTFSGECLREARTVLDSRRTGIAMYYQTVHGRPMVGGYISRSPQRVLDEYRRIPGMDCLFWSIGCEAQRAREAADRLSISHIIVARNDKRSPYLAAFGFDLVYTDPYSEIWKVTPPQTVTK